MTGPSPQELRDEILLARDADPLEALARDLIDPAPLSDDEKSGLWLYAWSGAAMGRSRRFAPARETLLTRG